MPLCRFSPPLTSAPPVRALLGSIVHLRSSASGLQPAPFLPTISSGSGSTSDPVWVRSRSTLGPLGIHFGSSPDPLWIRFPVISLPYPPDQEWRNLRSYQWLSPPSRSAPTDGRCFSAPTTQPPATIRNHAHSRPGGRQRSRPTGHPSAPIECHHASMAQQTGVLIPHHRRRASLARASGQPRRSRSGPTVADHPVRGGRRAQSGHGNCRPARAPSAGRTGQPVTGCIDRLTRTVVAAVQRSGWLPGRSEEHSSNPLAPRRLEHRFAAPVFVGRACAAFQQQPDDSCLLLACVLRTAPSAPRGLNGQVQGRRAGLVRCPRVCTPIQQRSDRGQRPCSHGSVQGCHAAAVQGVGIRANRQEVLDRLGLCRRVPVVGVRRIVKRLGAAAILRVTVGPVRNQKPRDRTSKCRSSHVQSRVAGVQVVSDFAEKEARLALAASANDRRRRGQ